MKLADVFAFLPLSPKSKVMGVTAHLCAMQAELTLHLTQPQIPDRSNIPGFDYT